MTEARSRWPALPPVLRSRGAVVLKFFSAQSISMVLYLLFGLACVRLMPTAEYAKFVVVNGIMGTVLVLMDSNLTGTLMPLVGERVHDKKLIADYVASLRHLAVRVYVPVALGTMVVYPYLVKNRGWSRGTVAGMVLAIVVTTWFARMASNYFPVLLMTGDRDTWYKANLIASVGTLLLLMLCWAIGWLGAFQAITINVLGYVFVGVLAFRRCRHLLGTAGRPDAEKRKAIVRLALPNVPQSIFFALQGQLSLYLMTFFGKTSSVASIGALSRLGQLFAIFMMANSLLVEPYFAKLPKEKLKKNFALALLGAAVIAISVWSFAALMPNLLLWVLGSQYGGMQHQLRLAVGASAISCFSGVLWGINSSRRFVYWWNVSFGIALTFAVQALFIWKADLSLLNTALWMNIATNLASLLVNVTASGWGFWRGPREAEKPAAITAEEQEARATLELAEVEASVVPVAPPARITDEVVPE